jgi:hypothetical protein
VIDISEFSGVCSDPQEALLFHSQEKIKVCRAFGHTARSRKKTRNHGKTQIIRKMFILSEQCLFYQNPRAFHQAERRNRDRGKKWEYENQTSGTKDKPMVFVHDSTICKVLSRPLDNREI